MNPELNKDILRLNSPGSVAYNDKIKRLIAAGKNIIQFQVGDPDFKTPYSIISKANRFMLEGDTHYVNSIGTSELRNAVSEYLLKNIDVKYDPESEIQITTGAVHAYFAGLKAVIISGDEVLIPDPTWNTHKTMVEFLGGVPISVRSEIDNNYFPKISDLQEKISSKTKALVINSPGNPTGAVAKKSYVKALVEFAAKNNLFIISDEVYHKLIYDDAEHYSPAQIPGGKERTILINSLSKTYAMTGWRIGYLTAPKEVISQAQKASQFTITCAPHFIQKTAAFALTDDEVQKEANKMVEIYSKRSDFIIQKLRENNFEKIVGLPPKGAFYYFLDLNKLEIDSETLADKILKEAGIALTPGTVFGEMGEGYLRLSYAASMEDIKTGMDLFIDWLKINY